MKERGKAVETFTDFNYSCASEMPCNKHPNPNPSSVGICAYCLKERLVKLVCSECGEQRLSSSCSCSDVSSSSYRNSDVGSVGRISFLLENDKTDHHQLKSKSNKSDQQQVIFLRRSSSSCVEVKKNNNGFWKIKRLFKKKNKRKNKLGIDDDDDDEKSEIWVSDVMGVSRSRSLCSFRGIDEGSDYAFSSAKISDVTSGIFVDNSGRQSGYFGESEQRKSGFRGVFDVENGVDFKGMIKRGKNPIELERVYSVPNRSVLPVKESDFSAMDDSAFIDFKLDSTSLESKRVSSAARISGASDHGLKIDEDFDVGSLKNNNGSSCRIGVNERGLKRGNKSHKVWKWIFKYNNRV